MTHPPVPMIPVPDVTISPGLNPLRWVWITLPPAPRIPHATTLTHIVNCPAISVSPVLPIFIYHPHMNSHHFHRRERTLPLPPPPQEIKRRRPDLSQRMGNLNPHPLIYDPHLQVKLNHMCARIVNAVFTNWSSSKDTTVSFTSTFAHSFVTLAIYLLEQSKTCKYISLLVSINIA